MRALQLIGGVAPQWSGRPKHSVQSQVFPQPRDEDASLAESSALPPKSFSNINFINFVSTSSKCEFLNAWTLRALRDKKVCVFWVGIRYRLRPPYRKRACLPLETGGTSFQQTRMNCRRAWRSARRRCPACLSAWRRSCRTGGRWVRRTGKREMTRAWTIRRTVRMSSPNKYGLLNQSRRNEGTVRLGYPALLRCHHQPVSDPG